MVAFCILELVLDDESDLAEVNGVWNGRSGENDAAIGEACWDPDSEVEYVGTCPHGKGIVDGDEDVETRVPSGEVAGVEIHGLSEGRDRGLENEEGGHGEVLDLVLGSGVDGHLEVEF